MLNVFKKILPYLIILGMGVFIYITVYGDDSDINDMKSEWKKAESNYISHQKNLEYEINESLIVIDIIKGERNVLQKKLDEIQKIRNNEKPLNPYVFVDESKLLDSILYYTRQ